MKETKIISAYPCCGKTYAFENYQGIYSILDSDSGQYEMLVDALGGPDHAGTPLWWDTGRNF